MRRRVGLATALLLAAAPALAETHRVAVVVGNNAGADLKPLRYAEADAGKMARLLAEVGQVGADDLFLLQGQPLSSVEHAMALARERVAHWHRSPTDRVLLIFYFSGHSDGEALELGTDRLAFSQLRELLRQTEAEVRVAIVDSCRSGALLAAKGAAPGPSFKIRLSDDLASTGQVLLASSAADEVALESAALGGSIFTHYLVSGLRGAADLSGDGRVTLSEAYNYAYTHTLSSTVDTAYGAQHPAYDYRLSGQGELVLSELSSGTAALELPAGYSSALVQDLRRDQVLAELVGDGTRRLAVEPGDYAIRANRDGHAFLGRFTVADGEQRQVSWDELRPFNPAAEQVKGSPSGEVSQVQSAAAPPLTLSLSGGVSGGVADGLGPVLSGVIDVAGREALGLHLSAALASGSGPGFRESAARLLLGYRFGWSVDRLTLFAGPELGGGLLWQSPGGDTPAGDLALEAGAELHLLRRLGLILTGQLAGEVLQRDSAVAFLVVPGVWLGLRVGLGD